MGKRFTILLCLILIISSGCKNQETEIKKKDFAPESMSNLNSGINKILKNVGEIEKINMGLELEEEKPEEKSKKEAADSESKDSKKGQDAKDENSSESSQDKEEGGSPKDSKDKGKEEDEKMDTEESDKETEIQGKWKEINKNIEEIYENWSLYMPESVKKGIGKEKRDQFEKSINKITNAIENKKIMDIYDFGSQSLLNLKSFYDLYTDEITGEINKLKYSIYQYYIRAISGKKEEAMKVLKDNEENINNIKFKLKDNNEKLDKIDTVIFSFESMEKSLEENSKRLFSIKKDVGIKDLENLE